MIRLVQRKLIIPRGDTGSFSIPIKEEVVSGDVAIFAIFDELTKTTVFEKTLTLEPNATTLTISFTSQETQALTAGRYKWDVRIYHSPIYDQNKIIGGAEVNSYYAAYSLPTCEIREVVR